jgi:hypothetical protein
MRHGPVKECQCRKTQKKRNKPFHDNTPCTLRLPFKAVRSADNSYCLARACNHT